MSVISVHADLSPRLKLTIRFCQAFYLLCFGLGLSSLAIWWPGNLALLTAIIILVRIRFSRRISIPILPDGILVSLPYLWSMNAVGCFKPWWPWLIPLFLLVLGAALTVCFLDWQGRPPWRTRGLGLALLLAFIFVVLYSSVLRLIFPFFSLFAYRTILAAGLLFFGGIPICQLAGIGILFPDPMVGPRT